MFYKQRIKCLFYPEIVKHSKTLLLGVLHFGGSGLLFGRFFCLGLFVLTDSLK